MTSLNYRQGAVTRPTDPTLLRKLDDLVRAFPQAEAHREGLRRLGSEVVYARELTEGEFRPLGGVWIALVRFSEGIENRLGLTREVLLLYSPHRDLQFRTFQAIGLLLQGEALPREVTSGVALVSSPDPRQEQKLDDWSRTQLTAIPLPSTTAETDVLAREIVRALERRLFSRDLYAETLPVSGRGFFGRRTLLQALLNDARSHRVSGIFGLRKSGKTSLLKQIGEELRGVDDERFVFVLRDLESYPSPPRPVVAPLLVDLREAMLDALRAAKLRTRELMDITEPEDMLAFKRALQAVLRKERGRDVHIIIALDEIEFLFPPDCLHLETQEVQEIPQFLGVLRSLTQENENFSFLIAGLASASIEEGILYGRHNPLFSWAKAYYVPPFSIEEASELLRELGRRMGIEWDGAAIGLVHSESGGHPFLLRDLASVVSRQLPLAAGQRGIRPGDVHRKLVSWKRSIAGQVAEIIQHIERFYPTEKLLLDAYREDPALFRDLVEGESMALHHLIQLGLLRETSSEEYALSSLIESRG